MILSRHLAVIQLTSANVRLSWVKEGGSEDRLGRLRGFRFERLCLHRLALIIGGKLKHLRLRCLVPECQSLMATFFRPRTVSFAGGNKRAVVRWQFASPDPLIAPQALGRLKTCQGPRGKRAAGITARERNSSGPTRRTCDNLVSVWQTLNPFKRRSRPGEAHDS